MDGALDGFTNLLMIGTRFTRRAVLEKITDWVARCQGRLLATERCCDWELEPVEEFDALFGILPDSEDAWGHCQPKVRLAGVLAGTLALQKELAGTLALQKELAGTLALQNSTLALQYPSLAAMKQLHVEHAWLGLHPATEKWLEEDMRPGQSGTTIHPVSALFRRAHGGGGEAIMFTGYVNFKYDKEACFDDGNFFPKFIDDLCAQSGVKPWGIQPDEIARGRVNGKTIVLTENRIEKI